MIHWFRVSLPLVIALVIASVAPAPADDPGPVLVVDVSQAAAEQRILCAGIQGLANREAGNPQVFLLTNGRDSEWLDYSLHILGREAAYITPAELLERLQPKIRGQALYDPAQPYTLDLATTVAGLRDLVISPTDLNLPTLFDFRGRWSNASDAYRWAIGTLLPECSQSKLALLSPDAAALRDFAVQRRMFTFSPPVEPYDENFQDVLFRLPPGTAIYGEAPPDVQYELSRTSHYFVPAAAAANLSFLSQIEPGRREYQYLGYLEATAPRYLTLILDCSDLDFALNDMPDLWASPSRGALPLGWAIPGALAEAAPPVARRYYADAYWSGSDQFVLGYDGAGYIDLGAAAAPYAFFDATARARAALDAPASLFYLSPDGGRVGDQVVRCAAATGVRGLFVTSPRDFPPAVYEGIAAVSAPRFSSLEAAVTYLDRIPLDRRCVALVLDSRWLGPQDAAHIAAYVSNRYVTLPPGEMIEMVRELSLPTLPGAAGILVSSVDYGEPATPGDPIPVSATLVPAGEVGSAAVIYRPADHPLSFAAPMLPTADGSYSATLPPLPQGGEIVLRLRARDRAGRAVWSPTWTLTIPRTDTDSDGLSDAEEGLLLTDPTIPDTDGDGLRDGTDFAPLQFDRFHIVYLGPVEPPSDLPYLAEPGASRADGQGRHLEPGQSCLYRLPLTLLPPGAPAVVALDATGPAKLAVGADPDQAGQRFEGELDHVWYSDPLPPERRDGDALLHIACPEAAGRPLVIRAVSILSPPGAPSIMRVSPYPPHPGPKHVITVSALIFSPKGVAEASLTYRVNAGGTITMPMEEVSGSQTYQARIPSLNNRDELEYWIRARDAGGNVSETAPIYLPIGAYGREVVSLLACRHFLGEWIPAPEWEGCGRLAPEPGLRDSAHINLRGGTYTVWVLAGGRGQSIDVLVRDQKVGTVDPAAPDGWQRVGRVRLDSGRHEVQLLSRARPDAPAGASPRYAGVIFAADSSFDPPANRTVDIYDSIALLFPPADHTLSGQVELEATGAGNITGAEFSIDGEVLRRVSGPPFRFTLNAQRLPPGPHLLRVEAVDRAGPTGLAVEVPVTVAH